MTSSTPLSHQADAEVPGQRLALVVEDDPALARALSRMLESGGLAVETADTGTAAMRALPRARPSLILLDLTLPDFDGWRVLDRIRELSDAPVIVVSGRRSEMDKVRAFRAGADDYITKPFGRTELLARVEVQLRRTPAVYHREVNDDGVIEMDLRANDVRVLGRPLDLTPLERKVLTAFVEHPGQVLSQVQLLRLVWGGNERATERVKANIHSLRSRFRDAGVESPIETVRGFGYRYDPRRVQEG